MLGKTILVTDDRRRSVPLLRLRQFRTSAAGQKEGARALEQRLARFMFARGRRWSVRGLGFEVLLGASVLLAFVGSFVFLGFFGPLGLLGVVVAGPAAVNYYMRETGERKHRREFAASYVAEGFCGSCGYSLLGLPEEEDGCVTCPECGASWRAERIVAPAWDEGRARPPRGPNALTRWLLWIESPGARTTGDAQGRLVPVADFRLRLWDPSRYAEIDIERLATLRRRLWRLGMTWRLLLLIGALIPGSAGVSLAVLWARGAFRPGLYELLIMAVVWLVFAMMLLIGLLGSGFAKLNRMARVIVEEGLCPTCGAELSKGRDIGDRRVVCASCGATWRLGNAPTRSRTPSSGR